jgi:hypothetical protein
MPLPQQGLRAQGRVQNVTAKAAKSGNFSRNFENPFNLYLNQAVTGPGQQGLLAYGNSFPAARFAKD